jgi:hypothetical protein
MFETMRPGPSPVLLCVTDSAQRAAWIFEHLTREYELLRNPDDDNRTRWVTIQIDSKIFDADKGNEAVPREMVINPRETPPDVRMKPVVGGAPEVVMRLEEFRAEWPTLRSAFRIAEELHQQTNPGEAAELGIGPTFEELLEVSRRYVDRRVVTMEVGGQKSDPRDIGIPYWRGPALDVLENAIRGSGIPGVEAVPILGAPEWLDTAHMRRFQWTGLVAEGNRCHTNKVPCHTDLEKRFSDFLDGAKDVVRYFKNERLGFSVTYYESNRHGSTTRTSSSRRAKRMAAR